MRLYNYSHRERESDVVATNVAETFCSAEHYTHERILFVHRRTFFTRTLPCIMLYSAHAQQTNMGILNCTVR